MHTWAVHGDVTWLKKILLHCTKIVIFWTHRFAFRLRRQTIIYWFNQGLLIAVAITQQANQRTVSSQKKNQRTVKAPRPTQAQLPSYAARLTAVRLTAGTAAICGPACQGRVRNDAVYFEPPRWRGGDGDAGLNVGKSHRVMCRFRSIQSPPQLRRCWLQLAATGSDGAPPVLTSRAIGSWYSRGRVSITTSPRGFTDRTDRGSRACEDTRTTS